MEFKTLYKQSKKPVARNLLPEFEDCDQVQTPVKKRFRSMLKRTESKYTPVAIFEKDNVPTPILVESDVENSPPRTTKKVKRISRELAEDPIEISDSETCPTISNQKTILTISESTEEFEEAKTEPEVMPKQQIGEMIEKLEQDLADLTKLVKKMRQIQSFIQ